MHQQRCVARVLNYKKVWTVEARHDMVKGGRMKMGWWRVNGNQGQEAKSP